MIISFSSLKGGTSKTTSCINLAYALSQNKPKKYKVLVVDFDTQSGATHHLSSRFNKKFKASIYDILKGKCKPEGAIHTYVQNLDLIPVSPKLAEYSIKNFQEEVQKNLVDKVKEVYDFIFFDLSTSVCPLTTIPLSVSDYCIIPVFSPGGLSLLGLQAQAKEVENIRKGMNDKLQILGVLASFVDRTKISKEVIGYLSTEWREKFFQTLIRNNTKISQASCIGKTIFEHDSKSNGAKDYSALCKEFLKRLNLNQKGGTK